MKKSLLLLFAAFATLVASAQDKVEIDGIWYNLDEETQQAEVTSGDTKYSGSITIPATVIYEAVNYSVTNIGSYAFAYCSISSVTIPLGVTNIGGHAFYSCSLTSINLPEGVTSIGYSGFCGSDLISITIPNSVTSIEKFTFSVCSNLTTITISEGVKNIDGQAFYLSNLESITCESVNPPTINHSILSSVESSIPIYVPASAIESYKSAECWSEYTNILPIGVVASGTCGDNLTWELTNVGRLVIEGEGEMYDFSSGELAPWDEYKEVIRAISIREGVTTIGSYAFLNCTALESVKIAGSVASIGESAFAYCSSLASITIPEGVIEIKDFAFADCVSLRDANISSTVEYIEGRTFLRCDNLSSIQINRENPVYYSGNNHDYILEKNSKTLVYSVRNDITEDVEHLGDFAFACRKDLGHLDIPQGVISYGDYTFLNSSINSIKIPSSLKYCGFATFGGYGYDCELEAVYIDDLTSWFYIDFKEIYGSPLYLAKSLFLNGGKIEVLSIPNNISVLKKYALAGWNGKEVILPSSIAEIKVCAFYGCSSLTTITCEAATPPTIDDSSTFDAVDKSIPVYVPAGSVEAYKSAQYWSEFTNILPLAKPVTDITLNKSSVILTEGETITLIATVTPEDADDTSVIWSSSDEDVAMVSSKGRVITLAPGTAIITATANDGSGVSASCEIIVKEKFLGTCATPTISYVNGEVVFACETEDATIKSEIKENASGKFEETRIALIPTYTITAYATKEKYEDSDVATLTLCWIPCTEEHESEETDIITIPSKPVLISTQGGTITVSGLAAGTEVAIYSTAGKLLATATATDGTATFATGLEAGSIAIVKMGDYSIRIAIK